MNRRANPVLGIAILLWVLIVISAYYVVHKPWSLAGGAASLLAVADCLLAAALLFVAGGVGRSMLGEAAALDRLEAVAVQGGLGLGLMSLAVLLVGLLGGITTTAAWLGLALGLLAFHRPAYAWSKDLISGLRGIKPVDWVERGSFALVVFLLSVSLLDAVAPPIKWDSLVYHLALPRHYLMSHTVGFVSGNLFSGFPQLPEMLYTWAMALHAGTTAAVLGWGAGLMGLLGLMGVIGRGLGTGRRWLAVAVVFSGFSLWQGLAWAYVDHWVLTYGAIMLIALDAHSRRLPGPWLLTVGAAVGFAASSKYSAVLLGLGVAAWLLVDVLPPARQPAPGTSDRPDGPATRTGSLASWLRDTALVGVVALALFAPWLLKNYLLAGNPIYPFLFPGKELDALRQTFHAHGEASSSVLQAIALPWSATVLGVEGGAGFNTDIGPMYLALIPGVLLGLGAFKGQRRRLLTQAGVLGILVWVLWGLGGFLADPLVRSRHYYGYIPVLAVLAVAGFESVEKLQVREIRIGWVISRLVLFAFALTAIGGIFHLAAQDPLPVVTGRQASEDYLADQLGWFGPTMAYLEELPPTAKVEMLWEARSYYCPRECVPDEILDKWWHLRRTKADNNEIARSWADQGITHVLIYDFGADFERRSNQAFDPSDWDALQAFRQHNLELVQRFGDSYSLYRLAVP